MSRRKTTRSAKTGTSVREPAPVYGQARSLDAVRAAIKAGFPIRSADSLSRILDITSQETADLLGISPSTLARRKSGGQRLTAEESDRVYRLDKVWAAALRLFDDDADMARRWLKTPLDALNGETPLAFCDTEVGARFVRDLIGRLEHGVFS